VAAVVAYVVAAIAGNIAVVVLQVVADRNVGNGVGLELQKNFQGEETRRKR